MSDNNVIRRVRGGQVQEFRVLVERHQKAVFLLAFRILGRREDAEDAAQDAFVRAYQSLHTYSDSGKFWPWIRRITVNCCIKKLPREFPSDELERTADAEQCSVEADVLRKCELQELRKAIAGLPAAYRTATVLRYQEDLSIRETAELLDEPAGTIRVRLHRALKMLSERMVVTGDGLQQDT